MASYSMYSRKLICILMTICGLPVLSDMSDEVYYNTTTGVRCIKCPPGFSFVQDCKPGSPNSTHCERCPDGSFSPEWNIKLCKKCTPSCQGKNEIIVSSCNGTHDIKCGCTEGYFHDNHDDPSASKCIDYTKCPQGWGAQTPVPRYQDLTCVRCVPGKNFSDVTSYSSCQTCRDCVAGGLNIIKNCTVKSNTVCDTKTTKLPTTETPLTHPTPSDDPDEKSNSTLGIIFGSLFGVIALIVLVVILIVYCYCKVRKGVNIFDSFRCRRRTNNGEARVNGADAYHSVNGVDANGVNGVCHVILPDEDQGRLKLHLKPGKSIFDVFYWLGDKLGTDHECFIKKLAGKELTRTDWDEPTYPAPMNLRDMIIARLEKWKELNPHPDNELLSRFYSVALEMDKNDICDSLRKEFAQSSTSISANMNNNNMNNN